MHVHRVLRRRNRADRGNQTSVCARLPEGARMRMTRCLAAILILCTRFAVAADDRSLIESEQKVLCERMNRLRESGIATSDQFADADIFLKGITWALRYDTNLAEGDMTVLKKAFGRAQQRIEALEAKQPI